MPRLICDMPPGSEEVTYYTLAGLPGDPRVDKLEVGPYGFEYELAGLSEGEYTVMCSACNAFQCSYPAPLVFTALPAPLHPVGLRILSD